MGIEEKFLLLLSGWILQLSSGECAGIPQGLLLKNAAISNGSKFSLLQTDMQTEPQTSPYSHQSFHFLVTRNITMSSHLHKKTYIRYGQHYHYSTWQNHNYDTSPCFSTKAHTSINNGIFEIPSVYKKYTNTLKYSCPCILSVKHKNMYEIQLKSNYSQS